MLTCITCMNQLNTTNNGGSRLLQEDEETETPRTKQATKSLTLQESTWRRLVGREANPEVADAGKRTRSGSTISVIDRLNLQPYSVHHVSIITLILLF